MNTIIHNNSVQQLSRYDLNLEVVHKNIFAIFLTSETADF
jgi:hypothetical protein